MPARRVLVVSDEMEVGGSQRQIAYLLAGLDRREWAPELLFFRKPSFLSEQLRDAGIPVHHIPKRGRIDPNFVLALWRLLRAGRYDVVHAFSLTAELWTLLAAQALRARPPLVSSVRGLYLDQPAWFWLLKRRVIARSAAVIANARACAMAASARSGATLRSVDVVANCVAVPAPMDAAAVAALRGAIGAPPGRTFGLFVGRLVAQKNPACLMAALAALPAAIRPWIAMAGDGPLRATTEAMVDRLGLRDDVAFLGERRDTTALMACADYLVLPSVSEGMPNVVLEAMAAGCAVIASRVGGSTELVADGQTGLLFDSNDHRALAACLQRLGADPALRAQLAAHGRARVEQHHSVRAMVDATAAVYVRCIERQASPVPPSDRTSSPSRTGVTPDDAPIAAPSTVPAVDDASRPTATARAPAETAA